MAYDPAEWSDLFVATAGAAAALTGLLFVAVSINLERVLAYRGLPERALASLVLLLGVTIASILALAPGQSATALGVELLVLGLIAAVAVVRLLRRSHDPAHATPARTAEQAAVAALGVLPFVIGGVSLIAESGGGLYWVLAGVVGGIVGGVANAWVLLVEILR